MGSDRRPAAAKLRLAPALKSAWAPISSHSPAPPSEKCILLNGASCRSLAWRSGPMVRKRSPVRVRRWAWLSRAVSPGPATGAKFRNRCYGSVAEAFATICGGLGHWKVSQPNAARLTRHGRRPRPSGAVGGSNPVSLVRTATSDHGLARVLGADAPRILRPPSLNHKHAPPRAVRVLTCVSSPLYPPPTLRPFNLSTGG
jgi:hypothetical protein